MESTQPQLTSPSELSPVNGNGATPFSQQTVVLTKQAYIELRWQANYWRAQHERLVEREATLQAEVAALQATIRDLTQRLYGAKSEQSAGPGHGQRVTAGQDEKAGAAARQSGARPQ